MDPRISPIKPHQGFRQLQRQSQRRYNPRANGHPVRYIPPSDLRQSIYGQSEATESRRYDYSRTFVEQDHHERVTPSSHISNNYQMSSRSSVGGPVILDTHSDRSPYVCVSMDYVPDRGRMLWSRWILIVLCLGQLISAFAVIGCHAIDFSEDTKLEVGVSLGLLAFGNIFASGIVTGVLFFRRWRNEEVRAKSEDSEANHEAWICTKVALSLIGMAPISRYVELFAVYRRLSKLERRLKKERASAANSTSAQNRELMSQSPTPSISLDPSQPNRDRERLHRLRRLFIQLDFDACVVGLANATLGAGPFAIAQGVLYLRRLMLNRMMPNSTGGAILASFIFSLLWLTSTACQFQPDAHYLPPSQLLRKAAHQHDHLVSASGRILLFFARGFHITIRMITFTFFAGLFGWMLGVVVIVHALFYLIMLMIYRGNRPILSASYKPNPSYRRPLDQRLQVFGSNVFLLLRLSILKLVHYVRQTVS
ncbi:unnamed protein product [Rodentolepis nana]|uniref:XK-related protein n=1 Tax=Rodentolepis nana TaxID=102285 RepID=A0A0R3T294_RODNA|nr:unnamed protein product [Rodentolepis nana]